MPSSVESFFVRSNQAFDFEHFNAVWLLVATVAWALVRQIVVLATSMRPGRTVGILHAILCILIGIPVIMLLTEHSLSYSVMMKSMVSHLVALKVICNLCCYMSVGYFIMDSYFLLGKPYLKHHIGAICVWLSAAAHYDCSLIHGVVLVCLFETGAVLVQMSRSMGKVLSLRTLICIGYTLTRVTVSWYWGFTLYTSYLFYLSHPAVYSIMHIANIPIHVGLCFLIALNLKWCFIQWKSLGRAFSNQGKKENFYEFHQKIIGNTTPGAQVAA